MINNDNIQKHQEFNAKSAYVLTKSGEKISDFEDEFSRFGVQIKSLDVTQLTPESGEKFILLIRHDLLTNLEPGAYENQVVPSYYIYSYSSDKLDSSLSNTESHLILPISGNDITAMIDHCKMKNNFEKEISELKMSLNHLESIAVMGSYTGSLIHDLNNFNTLTMTSLDTLKLINDRDIKNEKFDFLIGKGLKGSQMLNALGQRYQKIIQKRELNPTKFINLLSCIEGAVQFLTKDLSKNQIKCTIEIDQDFKVLADEVTMLQIALNLVKNSIYEIKNLKDRWINIKVKITEKTMVLIFIDSGSGIPSETRDKIFDHNFTTKPSDEGTGFGLGYCKRELKAIGLNLRYINSKNTAFGIEIPQTKFKLK